MEIVKAKAVDTSIGPKQIDSAGSPVGVVRLDPEKSYSGNAQALQSYLTESDQAAWEKITRGIDYTYESIDQAFSLLDQETGFSGEIRSRLEKGQKLLFKPNLVAINSIDPFTYGETPASTACTEWPFVAAVMRWFHDKVGISYYQMSIGEAATTMSGVASFYSRLKKEGLPVTTEAVIEGRSEDFIGGWGFYYVRKYLAERLEAGALDDPMKGYDESVSGTYLTPGRAGDRLMVYDLNRICDDMTKGRDVEVPGGQNFDSIILHKVIVGGDPSDQEDMKEYPGAILINLPRLKVHVQALLTNIIKNLGIGLYPMEASRSNTCRWEYGQPHKPIPGMKGGIPHQRWVGEIDLETCLPKRNPDGTYAVTRTAGLTGTMVDIVKAVAHQGIYMMHVVDGIQAINRDHTGGGMGVREPEGLVVAGVDPVAADLFCARYIFSNMGLKQAREAGLEDGHGGYFPQVVPIPEVEGDSIVSRPGYDCPLSRDICFQAAEERGLGQRLYYVVGSDVTTGDPLASVDGRLGGVREGVFSSIYTSRLYHAVAKMPWDMQKTFFAYLKANDQLAGTNLLEQFLNEFDEDGDGIVTYEEKGRKGIYTPMLLWGGVMVSSMGVEDETDRLRLSFSMGAMNLKLTFPEWNVEKHDQGLESFWGMSAQIALNVAELDMELPDPLRPSQMIGRGKWPRMDLMFNRRISMALYGLEFPARVSSPSFFSTAFYYADYIQNQGRYTGQNVYQPDLDGAENYIRDVAEGKMTPLDFTLFVPRGYGTRVGNIQPNVQETDDPAKILTVEFEGGKVHWPDLRASDIQTDATA